MNINLIKLREIIETTSDYDAIDILIELLNTINGSNTIEDDLYNYLDTKGLLK